jgi:hypothetical protein
MASATNNSERNEKSEQFELAASALLELVPNPDTIWGSVSYASLKQATASTFRELFTMSRQQDQLLQQIIGPARRAMDKALMVRAVVLKHEGRKIDGFLDEEFSVNGIVIAPNTDADIALNAAVFRLLTCTAGVPPIDKYRVSRAAKAMKGIEIICHEDGLELTFDMAGEILFELETASRRSLCELVDQRKADSKTTTTGEVSGAERGASPTSSVEDETAQPDGGADEDGAANKAREADKIDPDAGGDGDASENHSIKPSRPVIAAPSIEPDLLASYAAVGSVVVHRALPEADIHLVALIREGNGYVIKGPICSGDVAAKLIRRAIAG